jgi:hypothetical protein
MGKNLKLKKKGLVKRRIFFHHPNSEPPSRGSQMEHGKFSSSSQTLGDMGPISSGRCGQWSWGRVKALDFSTRDSLYISFHGL